MLYKKKIAGVTSPQKLIRANIPKGADKELRTLSKMGLGTIWFGRQWPMDFKEYKYPSEIEIENAMMTAIQGGIRMFDTAAAYGFSEEKLGNFLKKHPQILKSCFIATKWGEEFNINQNTSTYNHSLDHLNFSLKRSLERLPVIHLLYIHKATKKVLIDSHVKSLMEKYKTEGFIKYTGASISDEKTLEEGLNRNYIWTDFVQVGSWLARKRMDLIRELFSRNICVVTNSPYRKSDNNLSPQEAYNELIYNPYISFILSGTRNHISETINYFRR